MHKIQVINVFQNNLFSIYDFIFEFSASDNEIHLKCCDTHTHIPLLRLPLTR